MRQTFKLSLLYILPHLSSCFLLRIPHSAEIKTTSLHRNGAPLFSNNPMNDEYPDFGEEEGGKQKEEERLSDEELLATMGEWDDKVARFNIVHLTGRIGQDPPEPKYFENGNVVINLSLATQRKYHPLERKVENVNFGEEETDWYGLEIWGQTAEFVSKYVEKGARVGVVGRLKIDTWTDRETGELRNAAKIVVRDFDILETKAEADLRRSRRPGGGRSSFYSSSDDDNSNYDDTNFSAGTGGFFS